MLLPLCRTGPAGSGSTTAISYAIGECRDDLNSHCCEVKAGEGRLLDCLKKNEAKVSRRCNAALKESGLKK